jgi:hypothetical protein
MAEQALTTDDLDQLPADEELDRLQRTTVQYYLHPEVARRVDERANRITEQVRQTHGVINDETFQSLIADDEA